MKNISPKIFKQLRLPKPSSHKGDNGRLLIVAGNNQYHGSLIYAIKTASRIVDLIYVFSTPSNLKLIKNLKEKTAEFIPVTNLKEALGKVDCVLIGPGLGKGARTASLVKQVLLSKKKAVLDADALTALTPNTLKLLHQNHILTPHGGEFRAAFHLSPGADNLALAVKKYHCTIVLKSSFNIVGSPQQSLLYNPTGNAGMTKGGTGDVLAGLIAAFFCKNSAHLSACAGLYLNGAAGDGLYKKVGTFYNAEDLIAALPPLIHRLTKK